MKQSCCIHKNSKILREKLKKLGYLDNTCFTSFDNFLYTLGDNYYTCKNYQKFISLRSTEFIQNECVDCGTNEELFLAIAALSDDTNEHQWFTDGSHDIWVVYDSNEMVYDSDKMTYDRYKDCYVFDWYEEDAHKATVEELIEHFENS